MTATDPPSLPVRARWYPFPAPALEGETDTAYSDRLTGARGGPDLRPYDHVRNRQCSLGYHLECSERSRPQATRNCHCPCHSDVCERDLPADPRAAGVLASLYFLPEVTARRVIGHTLAWLADGMPADPVMLTERISRLYGSPAPDPYFATDVLLVLGRISSPGPSSSPVAIDRSTAQEPPSWYMSLGVLNGQPIDSCLRCGLVVAGCEEGHELHDGLHTLLLDHLPFAQPGAPCQVVVYEPSGRRCGGQLNPDGSCPNAANHPDVRRALTS